MNNRAVEAESRESVFHLGDQLDSDDAVPQRPAGS